MKHYILPGGQRIPALGLGTWKSAPGEVYAAVKEALAIGYRHIDCAPAYQNEAEVGKAVAEALAGGSVSRQDLWLTSKLWNNAHAPEQVQPPWKKPWRICRLPRLISILSTGRYCSSRV